MLKSDEDEKTCPILAAFSGNRDSTSTGSFWAVRCKREGCGWWDDSHARCAVAVISQELGKLISAGVTPR